ncbi:MAG: HAD family hydrolase [Promethearchaeota archaeon]
MIKNIIFDLGNVLLSFKPDEFLLRYIDDLKRINSFVSKVTRNQIWWQLDRGTISIEKVKALLFNQYPEERDLLILFFDHWMEMLTPITKNIKILRELKENGYNIYVLSNFIKEAFEFIEIQNDFFSLLDGRIISSEERVIKPEKKIYEVLLERYNLIPEECVFMDDIQGFLKPAKELGMFTIWVRPNTNLRAELKKLLVKI